MRIAVPHVVERGFGVPAFFCHVILTSMISIFERSATPTPSSAAF
jgi:hypothetical protein